MAECPNTDGSSPRTTKFDAPPPMCIDPETTYHAEIVTSMGTMFVQLLPKRAPKTVNNFVFLARYHYFDGVIFHRIIKDFVIQGGDPEGTGRGGPGYRFANEYPTNQYRPFDPALKSPVTYPRGTLAMANSGPDSNGSQFFIVYQDSVLPPTYTVFGSIDPTGMAAVDDLVSVGVRGGEDDGPPRTPIVIESVRLN